jgi:hypothetical protein
MSGPLDNLGVDPLSSPLDIDPVSFDDEPVIESISEPDPDDKKAGRTVDNLKGEMDRKLSAQMREIQELKSLVLSLRPQSSSPAAPTTEPANDITRMSSVQLKQFRAQITDPAQREALNDLIAQKTAEEVTSQRVQQFDQSQQFTSARDQANSMAVRRYPELLDPASEFRQSVDRHLLELKQRYGDTYLTADPRIVLNAANEIAMKTGYKARDTRGGGNSVATRHQSAPTGGDKAPTPEEEAADKRLAQRLSAALPTGKSFDPKRIKEGKAIYHQIMDQIVKGG